MFGLLCLKIRASNIFSPKIRLQLTNFKSDLPSNLLCISFTLNVPVQIFRFAKKIASLSYKSAPAGNKFPFTSKPVIASNRC